MNKQVYIQKIIQYLTWLSMQVEAYNNIQLNDINHLSESFYCDLLNLAFGYKLIDINILEPNSAAIDLGDLQNKLAIQVTSTSKLSKTKSTIEKFRQRKLHENYDRLIILNIVKKASHSVENIGDDIFKLDTNKDIWDIRDLIKKITHLETNTLKAIVDYLDINLKIINATSIPNEVSTITGIIEYISDEKHPDAGIGSFQEPFPETKIYKRFSEHSQYLEKRFNDLYIEYGLVLRAVKNESDFGQVKLRRAAEYLKNFSNEVLNEHSNNPVTAIAKIIEHFSLILSKNGVNFDAGAAEFYIVEQLIQCNVFPNNTEKS